MILITGSEGLIGRHLADRIEEAGVAIRRYDIRGTVREDIADRNTLAAALVGVQGVVHLAAVSRIVWAERQPERCRALNIRALHVLLDLCLKRDTPPWFVFTSSREVYGNVKQLPVSEDEDAKLQPMNTYARSKCEGERLVQCAREDGLLANIFRLSNVYGCPRDHRDRVAVAFANVAANGGVMRIEGAANTFDFTAVKDVAEGLWQAVRATMAGELLPPIHFVSGRGTTLLDLAEIAVKHARGPVKIEEVPARDYGVGRFVGDPALA